MNSKLLILESAEDARQCLKHICTKSHYFIDIDILSMNPDIKAILENNDIRSLSSSNYIKNNDYSVINTDSYKIHSKYKKIIINNIYELYPRCFRNMLLYYSYYSFYTIIWNARMIQNIISLNKYKTILSYEPQKTYKKSPWFTSEQNIVHIILTYIENNISVEHIVLKYNMTNRKYIKFNYLLIKIRYILRPIYIYMLVRISKKSHRILVPTIAKNMNILLSDITNYYKYINVYVLGEGKTILSELYKFFILLKCFLLNSTIYNNEKYGLQIIKISLSLLAPLKVKGKSKSVYKYIKELLLNINKSEMSLKIIKPKVITHIFELHKINDILSYLDKQEILSMGLEKYLGFCKPDLIFSQMSMGLTCMLGYYARKMNITSMLISHGSHVRHFGRIASLEHSNMAENMLYGDYEYLGIQTMLSYEYISKEQIPGKSIVKISPTILVKNNSEKFSAGKLTILYAGTIQSGSKSYLYETPDEHYESIKDTVEILSKCKNIKLIIKFRQTKDFSFDSLNSLLKYLPENVSIIDEGPLSENLAVSHLLMSFSSTTIEEALINNTPVLLYGGKGRYSHIPKEPFNPKKKDNFLDTVTFISNRKSLVEYFTVLNNNITKFIEHKFDFDKYQLKGTTSVIEWIVKNNYLNIFICLIYY